ncbi:hypothetical protein ACJX0J_008950, partial [Zea mays]
MLIINHQNPFSQMARGPFSLQGQLQKRYLRPWVQENKRPPTRVAGQGVGGDRVITHTARLTPHGIPPLMPNGGSGSLVRLKNFSTKTLDNTPKGEIIPENKEKEYFEEKTHIYVVDLYDVAAKEDKPHTCLD